MYIYTIQKYIYVYGKLFTCLDRYLYHEFASNYWHQSTCFFLEFESVYFYNLFLQVSQPHIWKCPIGIRCWHDKNPKCPSSIAQWQGHPKGVPGFEPCSTCLKSVVPTIEVAYQKKEKSVQVRNRIKKISGEQS